MEHFFTTVDSDDNHLSLMQNCMYIECKKPIEIQEIIIVNLNRIWEKYALLFKVFFRTFNFNT